MPLGRVLSDSERATHTYKVVHLRAKGIYIVAVKNKGGRTGLRRS